ncbi:MAG: hypothetical protein DRI57_18165, partial [Deltaproteobacteria bacterium]
MLLNRRNSREEIGKSLFQFCLGTIFVFKVEAENQVFSTTFCLEMRYPSFGGSYFHLGVFFGMSV